MVNDLRAEHDAVLASLHTRSSTLHFAHAAVSFFFAISLGGSAGKLWWDYSVDEPTWWMIAGCLSAAAFTYSMVRLVLATRSYRSERTQVDRLLSLRKEIGLDAPLSLPATS